MARLPISLAVDASTFAGLDPDDYPDGQRVTVTDDGEKEYEARGADGSRTWEPLHEGHVDDHEAAVDPHSQYTTDAEATTLAEAEVTDHETTYDHDVLSGASGELVVTETDSSPPVTVYTEDGTDWVYTEV